MIRILNVNDTALVLVDYQGRLAGVMDNNVDLHENMMRLIKGINILGVPIIWLEQYPKGLGPTEEEVQGILNKKYKPIAKTEFSGYQNKTFKEVFNQLNKGNILVAGIEAHICVYQTVKDLLEMGKHVEYVQDAITSRTTENKHIAINKMTLLGALPTSVEMLLFELMGSAKHKNFKEISQLIK